MATFALIHGGGGGVWDWHLVVPEQRKRGREPVAVRASWPNVSTHTPRASSEQTCGRARLLAVSFGHHDRAAAQQNLRRPGAARAARGVVVGLPLAGRPIQTAF
jgi:hypothetical protein